MKRIKYIHVFSSAVTAFLIAVTMLFTAGCVDGTRKQLSDCISSIQAIRYNELATWHLHYESGKSYYVAHTVLDTLSIMTQAPLTKDGTIDVERLRFVRIGNYSYKDGQLFSDLADSLLGFLHSEVLYHVQWALDNEILEINSNKDFCILELWGRPYGRRKNIILFAIPNSDGTILLRESKDDIWQNTAQ